MRCPRLRTWNWPRLKCPKPRLWDSQTKPLHANIRFRALGRAVGCSQACILSSRVAGRALVSSWSKACGQCIPGIPPHCRHARRMPASMCRREKRLATVPNTCNSPANWLLRQQGLRSGGEKSGHGQTGRTSGVACCIRSAGRTSYEQATWPISTPALSCLR